jgi:DHA1 family inner membrane transport protein
MIAWRQTLSAQHSQRPALTPDSLVTVLAAMFIGTAAMMMLGLAPILLGGLAGAGRLSEAQVGQAATMEILSLALGAWLGPKVLGRSSLPMAMVLVCLMLAVANLAIFMASSASIILAQRAIAGVLEGVLLGGVFLLFTHSRHPTRLNGLLLGVSSVPQIAIAFLLPAYVVPRHGVESGFVIIAVFAACAALTCLFLPKAVATLAHDDGETLAPSAPVVIFLTAAFLQNAGVGAAWNYTERLGHQHGLSASVVGVAIAASLAAQVLGSFLTAAFGARFSARPILIAGAALQTAVVTCLVLSTSSAGFVAAACVFGLFWLALQPYQLAELIQLDPTRRAAMLLPPVAFTGLSVGPLVVSFLVRGASVTGTFVGAAGLLVVSAALYIAVAPLLRRAVA